MNGSADRLLKLMYEWMKEAKECSSNLRALAQELKSLRQNCNTWETIGSTTAVVGSVVSICAALFTGGASLLVTAAVAGAVAGGTGAGVSVVSKITERCKSSSKLERVKQINKRCNEITAEMRILFEDLKRECLSSSADETDKYIVIEFLKVLSQNNLLIGLTDLDPLFGRIVDEALACNNPAGVATMVVCEVVSVLSMFSLELEGTLLYAAVSTAGNQIGKDIDIQGASKPPVRALLQLEGTLLSAVFSAGKSAAMGAFRFLGGAVGLVFSLPEAIYSWKEAINNKHETEASRSLRDAAETMDKDVNDLSTKLQEIIQLILPHILVAETICLRNMLKSLYENKEPKGSAPYPGSPVAQQNQNISATTYALFQGAQVALQNRNAFASAQFPMASTSAPFPPQNQDTYARVPFPVATLNALSQGFQVAQQIQNTFASAPFPMPTTNAPFPFLLGQQKTNTDESAPFQQTQQIAIGLLTKLPIYISNNLSHNQPTDNSNQPSYSGNNASHNENFDKGQSEFHQSSERGQSSASGASAPPDPPRDDDGDSGSETSDSGSTSDSESSDEISEEEQLNMALLNSQSVYKFFREGRNEKSFPPDTISRVIQDNNLNMLLITETWLPLGRESHEGFREILPPNFNLISSPRAFRWPRRGRAADHIESTATRRPQSLGGGVAIVYSNELNVEQVYFSFTFTFEYLAATMRIPQTTETVLMIAIYRPRHHSRFFEEFQGFLSEVFSSHRSVILTGDFNVMVNEPHRRVPREFLRILEEFGLSQLVSDPTRGPNILDLVIAHPDFGISSPTVRDNNFSDHHTVFFRIPARRLYVKYKKKDKRDKKRVRRSHCQIS